MYRDFIRAFVKDPIGVGTVVPSSGSLARKITADSSISSASVVVEYGPGTGALTSEILRKIGPDTFFFVVENNPQMASAFRQKFPDVLLVEDSVENMPVILRDLGKSEVDYIISGLPWAAFSFRLQDRLLRATISVLRDGGRFATYAYPNGLLFPPGQRFRRKLKYHFSKVTSSPIIWKNMPPAFIYRCVK